MEVRQAIDDLRHSIERITAAEELLEAIVDPLTALRRSYPSQHDLFNSGDVEFLKRADLVSKHLRAFIELKEELGDVNSLREYEDLVDRLGRLKTALAGLPVAIRVATEIRGLNERLPAIRQQDEEQRQFRLNGRIVDLERNPRRCPSGHTMVIREGTHGHFWGCSRYPFCSARSQLTPEEKNFLGSSQSVS